MFRKSSSIGNPMLVKLPERGYENTGEGGLAFFFVVKSNPPSQDRQACITGGPLWPLQDCQIKPRGWPWWERKERDGHPTGTDKIYGEPIDAGLLIGSTGLSLFSDGTGEYFTPKVSDLTSEGKRLYHTLKRIYGDVTIVTLLDT